MTKVSPIPEMRSKLPLKSTVGVFTNEKTRRTLTRFKKAVPGEEGSDGSPTLRQKTVARPA